MKFNYHNRHFRTVANDKNGDVGAETIFHYRQQGEIVWATYEGGSVIYGTLLAKMYGKGRLYMVYQHLTAGSEFKTGVCQSVPELLGDGRYRMRESWRWTCGDKTSGISIIEEIPS